MVIVKQLLVELSIMYSNKTLFMEMRSSFRYRVSNCDSDMMYEMVRMNKSRMHKGNPIYVRLAKLGLP